jgi:NAD(P)-dependent dehydrogenase (short-subunit alcohol dehydrogenase family)
MSTRLEHKTALATGATSNIGRAIATAFRGRRGARHRQRTQPQRGARRSAAPPGRDKMMKAMRRSVEPRWWTLVAICGATFILLVDVTIVQVALPTIQRRLGAGFTDLQWVIDG